MYRSGYYQAGETFTQEAQVNLGANTKKSDKPLAGMSTKKFPISNQCS